MFANGWGGSMTGGGGTGTLHLIDSARPEPSGGGGNTRTPNINTCAQMTWPTWAHQVCNIVIPPTTARHQPPPPALSYLLSPSEKAPVPSKASKHFVEHSSPKYAAPLAYFTSETISKFIFVKTQSQNYKFNEICKFTKLSKFTIYRS